MSHLVRVRLRVRLRVRVRVRVMGYGKPMSHVFSVPSWQPDP